MLKYCYKHHIYSAGRWCNYCRVLVVFAYFRGKSTNWSKTGHCVEVDQDNGAIGSPCSAYIGCLSTVRPTSKRNAAAVSALLGSIWNFSSVDVIVHTLFSWEMHLMSRIMFTTTKHSKTDRLIWYCVFCRRIFPATNNSTQESYLNEHIHVTWR